MTSRRKNLMEIAPKDCQEWLAKTDVVLVPIGSCEKHGNHIPMGCDSYITIETTRRAAEKAEVPHTPLIPVGYSPHHMGRVGEGNGTLTFRAETFQNVVYDIARSLIFHGFNKILFVSHHGSNTKIIDNILRQIKYETGAFVAWYKTPTERTLDVVEDVIEGDSEETPGWHSGEMETAMMMASNGDFVDMSRASQDSAHAPDYLTDKFTKQDGMPTVSFAGSENIWIPMEHHEYCDTATIGNPNRGTKKKGEALYERNSEHLASFASEAKKINIVVEDSKRDYPHRA